VQLPEIFDSSLVSASSCSKANFDRPAGHLLLLITHCGICAATAAAAAAACGQPDSGCISRAERPAKHRWQQQRQQPEGVLNELNINTAKSICLQLLNRGHTPSTVNHCCLCTLFAADHGAVKRRYVFHPSLSAGMPCGSCHCAGAVTMHHCQRAALTSCTHRRPPAARRHLQPLPP